MPGLPQFDAKVDRFNREAVAELFQWLWPTAQESRACADVLAESIKAAHAASKSCWSITMFADKLRLNVGQVEVLVLTANWVNVFVSKPLELVPDARWEMNIPSDREYIFAAVPVASGICYTTPDILEEMLSSVRDAHADFIRKAAGYKSISPFRKSFSPAVMAYLEAELEMVLPRPAWYVPPDFEPVRRLPEELDVSATIYEGAKYQIVVNAYERDASARRACIAAHGTCCGICGFSFGAVYGSEIEGLIHVHHLRPLSEIRERYQVDPVNDLLPVCPNCHAVIHHGGGCRSVKEVKEFLARAVIPN